MGLKIVKSFLSVLAFLLLTAIASTATEIDIKGFVDSYHAVRVKSPHDFLSSRTRVRMEFSLGYNKASAYVSFNGIHNQVIPSQNGIEIREAFIDYFGENWDVKVGRQIIVWGKADGVQITDLISPMDFTEFLARDYDDIRIPVDAFRIRYMHARGNLEFIWVPIFQPAILPSGDNPWAIHQDFPSGMQIINESPLKPKNIFKNGEFGGKMSFFLSGIDLALSSLYTWDKFPVYRTTRTSVNQLTIRPEHNRLSVFGLEFSIPNHSMVFRGETALNVGKHLETQSFEGILLKKNTWKWLIGIDWYPGSNWSLSLQLTDTFIFGYEDIIANDRHTIFSTFHISKKLMRETMTLSTFAYLGLNNWDIFDRTSFEYALTDELHLLIGIDFFIGNKGIFGQYGNNDEIWIKAKYSF
jgi:hypothetical protein